MAEKEKSDPISDKDWIDVYFNNFKATPFQVMKTHCRTMPVAVHFRTTASCRLTQVILQPSGRGGPFQKPKYAFQQINAFSLLPTCNAHEKLLVQLDGLLRVS